MHGVRKHTTHRQFPLLWCTLLSADMWKVCNCSNEIEMGSFYDNEQQNLNDTLIFSVRRRIKHKE